MAMNSTQIAKLLRPGLDAIISSMDMYPAQWKLSGYKTYKSDKNYEEDVEMKMLGLAQFRAEGAPTATDTMGQRIIWTYIHKTIGLQFNITQQSQQDNLYKSQFPMMMESLKASLGQTKDILGAATFNNGQNAAYPGGDGVPLFSTAHPIDGNTYANTPTVQIDLNEASLEAGCIAVQQFKNQAGLTVQTKSERLLVPATGQFVAERILGSEFRPGTANNDINAINATKIVPKGWVSNQFLTLNNSWFLLTNASDGLKYFQRIALKGDTYVDFSTDNVMIKATERYSFGWSNPRCAYGSYGP